MTLEHLNLSCIASVFWLLKRHPFTLQLQSEGAAAPAAIRCDQDAVYSGD
jgi:hypothetical protein